MDTEFAVGYARISKGIPGLDSVSLAAQRQKINDWCRLNDRELTAVHFDEVGGGRTDNRAGLQKAMAEACDRKAALIVYSLSRLARSTADTLEMARRLDAAGADLVSVTERLDTTSATGRMVFRILAVLAEFERELIVERTTAALQHMRAAGLRIGSVPYGYELFDGKRLRELPGEQAVIAQMLAWRQSGLTLRAIVDRLAKQGVKSKTGGRWHSKTVMGVLNLAQGPRPDGNT